MFNGNDLGRAFDGLLYFAIFGMVSAGVLLIGSIAGLIWLAFNIQVTWR